MTQDCVCASVSEPKKIKTLLLELFAQQSALLMLMAKINQKKKILHKNVVLIICSNDNDSEQKRHNIPESEEIDYVQQ